MSVVESIAEQHAEDVVSAWNCRDHALTAARMRLVDLETTDTLLEANINGCRLAASRGWQLIHGLDRLEPTRAAAFLKTHLVLPTRKEIEASIFALDWPKTRETSEGIAAALAWVGGADLDIRADSLAKSDCAWSQLIGVSIVAIQRMTSQARILACVSRTDVDVVQRVLRAVAELGLIESMHLCGSLRQGSGSNSECRFWSCWARTLLGIKGTTHDLVAASNDFPEAAELGIVTAVRSGKLANLEALRAGFGPRVWAHVIGSAADPRRVSDLLEQMPNPDLARAGGEAFSMITGVDLAYDDLETDAPAGFEAGPNDDPEDENVALEPDEDLPWPDVQKVEKWWGENRHRFQPGVRYLCGRPINEETCWWVLEHGYQRQRAAAAIELALLKPGRPLFNVKAPAWRQLDLIRRRKTA